MTIEKLDRVLDGNAIYSTRRELYFMDNRKSIFKMKDIQQLIQNMFPYCTVNRKSLSRNTNRSIANVQFSSMRIDRLTCLPYC